MRIEAECWRHNKHNSELLLESSVSVRPGTHENVIFLFPTKILVVGTVDQKRGKVMIAGKVNGIKAVRYEEEEDYRGENIIVAQNYTIEIVGTQELSIYKGKGKKQKEVRIFIDPDEAEPPEEFVDGPSLIKSA